MVVASILEEYIKNILCCVIGNTDFNELDIGNITPSLQYKKFL